jgi:ureidoglycolate hydrolase
MKIKKLTHKSIKPYGRIIDGSCCRFKPGDNGFGIVFKERAKGWRIAYLVVRKKVISRLECHPNTAETFEPVSGSAVIALASHKDPEGYEVFKLDKPVVLFKGVWHNVAAVSPGPSIKICEGSTVVELYHDLAAPITFAGRRHVR